MCSLACIAPNVLLLMAVNFIGTVLFAFLFVLCLLVFLLYYSLQVMTRFFPPPAFVYVPILIF